MFSVFDRPLQLPQHQHKLLFSENLLQKRAIHILEFLLVLGKLANFIRFEVDLQSFLHLLLHLIALNLGRC